MKISILLFAVVLFAASCAVKTDAVSLMKEADETRISLMRPESEVYGSFFKLRVFHSDLMQSTNHVELSPYPFLDSTFHDLLDTADAVIIQRMTFDSTYNNIKRICEGKQKFKPTQDEEVWINRYHFQKSILPSAQNFYYDSYFSLKKQYDDTCAVNGIRRVSMPEFAAMTSTSLMQWQDSLEQIGKMVAFERNDLKSRFPTQKGPEFFAAYQPVSLLEKQMKDFESQLAQLENSVSRFEEANKQDYIYFGKHIRPRMESESTVGILGALAVLMADCRSKHAEYLRLSGN